MEAMILAAGLGTRLRPLTDRVPKALVEVAGVPMLERVARRLVAAGARRIIVNVHHHAGQVERFLEDLELGAEVVLSPEPEEPLGTGGALRRAARLFEAREPFLLHNVDVVSDVDLAALHAAHREAARGERLLATLAVNRRPTSRPLLADDRGLLGVTDGRDGRRARARAPEGPVRELGFTGIHAVSPRLFDLFDPERERGRFSIWDPYLRLVGEGWRVAVRDVTSATWMDVGTPERLARAREALA